MSIYPSRNECISILKKAGCRPKIIVHCKTVECVASEISKIVDSDRGLVTAGALLHDLGRARDHTIMHAFVGSQMAYELGLPDEIVEIIRKHTGAGLDERDVKELGLPFGDYIPRTIEEKIVAHADNMVSGDTVVSHMHTVTKLTEKGSLRGARRVEDLHLELSKLYGDDLDNIVFKTGVKPCADYSNLRWRNGSVPIGGEADVSKAVRTMPDATLCECVPLPAHNRIRIPLTSAQTMCWGELRPFYIQEGNRNLMADKICSSCGIRLQGSGNTTFKCPNCGAEEIGRCAQCRDQGVKYECKKCGFVGP